MEHIKVVTFEHNDDSPIVEALKEGGHFDKLCRSDTAFLTKYIKPHPKTLDTASLKIRRVIEIDPSSIIGIIKEVLLTPLDNNVNRTKIRMSIKLFGRYSDIELSESSITPRLVYSIHEDEDPVILAYDYTPEIDRITTEGVGTPDTGELMAEESEIPDEEENIDAVAKEPETGGLVKYAQRIKVSA